MRKSKSRHFWKHGTLKEYSEDGFRQNIAENEHFCLWAEKNNQFTCRLFYREGAIENLNQ